MGLRKTLGLKRERRYPAIRDWHDSATYNLNYWGWARRARAAVDFCRDCTWVCDIGCGSQTLRHFLPTCTVYLPADLRRWTPTTELCDLDAGRMPERSLLLADVAMLLGVLEHLKDPETTFVGLSRYSEFVVVSYSTADAFPKRPAHWLSGLSRADLLAMLERQGFGVERLVTFDKGRLLLRVRNTRFDAIMEARRREARNHFDVRLPGPNWASRIYHRARVRAPMLTESEPLT